jgi:hypothetical protein
MIEAYAFLAAFAVQILVMSFLLPAWFIRNFRARVARVSAEHLAQLYPGVDVLHARERFLAQYRVLTTTIAAFGLLLLGWQFFDLWRADWSAGKAELLTMLYFFLAFMLPLLLYVRFAVTFNKEHKVAERKRTAILQRRGLFDFVSPFVVFLAVLSYFLYAAFVLYIEQHPFPGFAGSLINIGEVTLIYAANAFALYITLYRGKKSPLETNAGRLHTLGLAVKGIVYMSIVIVAFISLGFSLRLLDLRSWGPFAHSIFFAIGAILASMGFAAPMREPGADVSRQSEVPS